MIRIFLSAALVLSLAACGRYGPPIRAASPAVSATDPEPRDEPACEDPEQKTAADREAPQ